MSIPSDDTASSATPAAEFKPDRTHILAAVIMSCIMLLVVGALPKFLFWLPLLPLIFIYWVLKSCTVVDESGITAHYAFKAAQHVDWDNISGIGFARSTAFVQTTNDTKLTLPGVSFNSLPQLEAASAGRIPDALTQGRMAANEKVVIVHKDGRQVLISKEEYEAQHDNTDSERHTND
ncbi:MAG: PH domain-containing protein [Corynebacterium sp.]|uniref:PH domain-containing protein n=1 Tax=Corynebacterium sp. TaxID=1720 RepID=UPI0026DA8E85|nr:PH domain-containing protein [Corynebacterium sp.]MDO5098301.1 PH domain-containing protein [Corynebacterium sp.]